MQWIREKRLELQSIINEINGCYTTYNRDGFTLKTKNGVIWSKNGKGKKWGKAFDGDTRFYAIIDFPSGCYEISEIVKRINLNEREENVQESGIRLRKDNPFDSIQISIFNDCSSSYSFFNEGFIDFVNEVASKVMVIK